MARTDNGLPGIYNLTPITLSSGDGAALALDSAGRAIMVGAVAHDAVDAGNPIKVGGYASGTAPTAVAAADRVNAWFDLNGRQIMAQSWSFLNIAASQATTVVKASAGILHAIVLNSAATATNTTVVYDHPSGVGTVIGRPAVTTATVPTTLIYDVAFANGLTIITATANGGDMTVAYL